jgi:hypothetical protein
MQHVSTLLTCSQRVLSRATTSANLVDYMVAMRNFRRPTAEEHHEPVDLDWTSVETILAWKSIRDYLVSDSSRVRRHTLSCSGGQALIGNRPVF